MKRFLPLAVFFVVALPALAQDTGAWLSSLPQAKDYVQKRASSYDRSGGDADYREIAARETFTLFDESGPGLISHIWITIGSDDPHHRSDDYFCVAYWYQTEPHAVFPALPALAERIPRLCPVGGPGNGGK